MQHMQKRLRDNELRILRGEQEVDENQVDNDSADNSPSSSEASFIQRARQPAAGFVSVKQPAHAQPTDKGLPCSNLCRDGSACMLSQLQLASLLRVLASCWQALCGTAKYAHA